VNAKALRVTLIVLTAIGVCLAAYLTYLHYSGTTPPCSIKGNPCSQVQKSRYSELVGVPVALIGLLGYIAILGSLLAPEGENSRLATMSFALVGFGFSAYLTYRELFTLHKICEWCVGSATLVTIIMCLSVWRFLRGDVSGPDTALTPDPTGAASEPTAPLSTAS
jgi:uncharacterized membrane protein